MRLHLGLKSWETYTTSTLTFEDVRIFYPTAEVAWDISGGGGLQWKGYRLKLEAARHIDDKYLRFQGTRGQTRAKRQSKYADDYVVPVAGRANEFTLLQTRLVAFEANAMNMLVSLRRRGVGPHDQTWSCPNSMTFELETEKWIEYDSYLNQGV